MIRKRNHCEFCGAVDPEVEDSYTVCCNEPLCEGEGPINGESVGIDCEHDVPTVNLLEELDYA